MNVTGIIVEYNPLHNGHKYHIEQTRKLTGCDYLVAVMSGNFVQRGEPSLVNKWARTEMALRAGVDLVVELPFIYSTSSAEGFAHGAISTLDSLGFVDNVCFGSEAEDMKLFESIAQVLSDEPNDYRLLLRKYLKEGLSYPAAREKAIINYYEKTDSNIYTAKDLTELIGSPNNILGIEYLKSIYRLSSKIKPYLIKRVHNSYNQTSLTGSISSATSIRQNINGADITQALPDYSYTILENERAHGRCPISLANFSDLILYKLRESNTAFIKNLLDVGEGLENKIKKGAENSTNVYELIDYIKNKRYTQTRIQRILLYSLLDITKAVKDDIKNPVNYIRVLGFNENGKMLLKQANKCSIVPIITNPSYRDSKMLKYDTDSTDIYVIGYENPIYKSAKQDFKIPPVII